MLGPFCEMYTKFQLWGKGLINDISSLTGASKLKLHMLVPIDNSANIVMLE